MVFPERLIPKPVYNKIDFEHLNRSQLVLIHYTETTDIWDEHNRLKSEHVSFQTDHLHDYSTNLLGQFRVIDVSWKWPKGSPFTDLWEPGQEVQVPLCPADVDWVTNRGGFFLAVPAFYQIRFAVETPNGTEQADCFVLHTPTRGNFWHCSLRWHSKGEDVTNWKPNKRKHILKAARTFIIQNALSTQPAYEEIPINAYNG